MNLKEKWLRITFYSVLVCELFFYGCPVFLLIPNENLRILSALLLMPLIPLLVIFTTAGRIFGKGMWNELGFKALSKADVLPVLSVIPLFFLFAGATALLKLFGANIPPQSLVALAKDCSIWHFCIIVLTAGVFAPVSEELIFRCVTAGFFKKVFPEQKWVYYIVPSLLFAVCHGINWQSFLLFFLALYLQKHFSEGSTTRVILMHTLFNWCSLSFLILTRLGILPS